ncbi:MAG: hypothetical protein MUF48_07730 [Pirellulaceae bacterium]|nr:hypothetical protein [Pirellulaceae bacterium]
MQRTGKRRWAAWGLWLCLAGTTRWAAAADWAPADGPLETRWTRTVSPERVWPEHPRPQLVRPTWVNLNGLWDYALVAREVAQPATWDGQILVPFPIESALSGVKKPVKPTQRLWYRRQFESPTLLGDQRLLLHFGAVDWQTEVLVNGQSVGSHTGGYDPFTFDITEAVRAGTNELFVAVHDPTDTGYQPRGKQVLEPQGIFYTAVTGIWQTVWLEVVPHDYIESLKIVPDIDRGILRVTVSARQQLPVTVTASGTDGWQATQEGTSGQVIELPVPQAKLWTPDTPFLYDLQISLTAEDGDVDEVTSYFGMRKTEVRKDAAGINRLMLNNQVLFQYGPLDQGWWPDGLYTPPCDEAIRYDIDMTKKYGMNMARKHVKYECARWYYWCDRLGLLVWQDMPSGDAHQDPESRGNYRRELQAMIDALHHFPSIVMWVPFNEGWGQHDTPDVVRWIEQYDPSRPVNEASGWTDAGSGAVSDIHSYPGPAMRLVEPRRAVVLGEFGGLGMPVSGHTWQAEKNWGYVSFPTAEALTDAYVDLLTRLRPLIAQGLSAAVYTQTTDVEIEVNGLMTYDRAVNKIDLDRAAAAARKLFLPPPVVSTLVPTSQQAPQSWQYTTSAPADTWFEPDFDDRSWQSGAGGFGTPGTPGAIVRTPWDGSDIWLRRTFELPALAASGDVALQIHHDEDADVYLNGELIVSLRGYTTSYTLAAVNPAATRQLRAGTNILAIHCRQTQGGQYIDAGLVLLVESEEPRESGATRAAPPDAANQTDTSHGNQLPLADLHVHIRGGMTLAKALARQQASGIRLGVLQNLGRGWELENDDQLRAFLDSVGDLPLYVGVQVNDRHWMHQHAPELLRRLDYVLADTMIMPMPDDSSPPVKLWLTEQYTIDDPEAWMQRYLRHNLRVLSEPIDILANPTFLPPSVAHLYDQLWTDERMRQIIQAAVDNRVALEINASSPWPHDRFIALAHAMGAKFTLGSNNVDDRPPDLSRCLDAVARFGLTAADLYVPSGSAFRRGEQ